MFLLISNKFIKSYPLYIISLPQSTFFIISCAISIVHHLSDFRNSSKSLPLFLHSFISLSIKKPHNFQNIKIISGSLFTQNLPGALHNTLRMQPKTFCSSCDHLSGLLSSQPFLSLTDVSQRMILLHKYASIVPNSVIFPNTEVNMYCNIYYCFII